MFFKLLFIMTIISYLKAIFGFEKIILITTGSQQSQTENILA